MGLWITGSLFININQVHANEVENTTACTEEQQAQGSVDFTDPKNGKDDCLKQTQCSDTNGKSMETILADNGSTITTEITEPLGGFDDTIKNNADKTVSAVYWKYSCYDTKNQGVSYYSDYATGSCPDEVTCTTVQVIFGTSGIGILKTYIAIVYRWAAGIVGIIAVLVMIISGIQISMDQGSGEAIGAAKTRILQSLAGLAVLFLSALILYTINPTFFTK